MDINDSVFKDNEIDIVDLTSKNNKNKEMTLDLILIDSEEYSLKISVTCTEEFKKLGWEMIESNKTGLIDKIKEELKNNVSLIFNSKERKSEENLF